MRILFLSIVVAAAALTTSPKAETINCTEIKPIPFAITVQGVYCLKENLGSGATSGKMIDILTNDVTIDMNGFVLDGSAAGTGTFATGIYALNRKNITIRNGTIRGFRRGIFLQGVTSSGHLVEDMLLEQNRFAGVQVEGSGHLIRNNRVENTGSGDPGTAAFGIFVQSANNTVIANNVVSDTSETSEAFGINVSGSALIEVRGNTILDTRDATTKDGIEISSSTDVTVIGNRILNTAGGI